MNNYDSSSITVLKGLEGVRKRPGMYIGSTDVNGLHHLVWEIIDNAIDEALAGYAKNIKITIKEDGSIIVEDDGRGIPVGYHSNGKTALEVIFTELHAGGKFGTNKAYSISGGLNGVGASVVNALSTKVKVNVFRDGKEYEASFLDGGTKIIPTKEIGPTSKRGTKVQFWPDYSIFKNLAFNFEVISERVRESSFLIPRITIRLGSQIIKKEETFHYEDGIIEFVKFVNGSKTPISKIASFSGTIDKMKINVAFQYVDDISETTISFVNNIKTRDGGKHEEGLKSAFTKVLNDYIIQQGLLKKNDSLEGSDIREGLTAIIAMEIPESLLQFVGQTKDKLGTSEARVVVEQFITDKLIYWLNEDKKSSLKIADKIITSAKAREAAKKARAEARSLKTSKNRDVSLSGKLTPAQSKDKFSNELFLVEGDSAGGSAKLGRDRKFQAILPLRGKVINAEKAKVKDILSNEEITSIIHSIGAGLGSEFELDKIKYGKVIIMTDADTDGAHIQTLLLTFFFRFMKPLIENGHIYVALPPLYKLTSGKEFLYAWDDYELKQIMEKGKKYEIQRYKGLGEMNSEQLWETTMNPETRTLIKVSILDQAIAERRLSVLMGENVKPRREWIENNIVFSLEDSFKNNGIKNG